MHISADATELDLPEFTFATVFTGWGMDPYLFVVTVWICGLYLFGVYLLRQRGDRWPVGRTIAFVGLGMGSFYFATQSGIGAYDTTLASVHMIQHMILSMVTPLFLALGAPVTLALRTLPAKPRSWLLAVVHSRVVKVLSFAPVAFILMILTPWTLYFTGWYGASVSSDWVHEMTHVHMVAVGCLFFWPLVGIDPIPGRVDYPFRILALVMTLPFHAFLGITLMNQSDLIAADHYLALRDGPMGAWLPDAAEDQYVAGGILWGAGELVGLVFIAVLFAQWVRSSMQEAKREDRRLDRLERAERVDRSARGDDD